MSVVKINVLTVPTEMRATLEQRFAGRAGLVEAADGFEHFELLRPVDGTENYLVYTRWRSEEDFQAWQSSQAFRSGHAQAAQAARAEQSGVASAPADAEAAGGHPGGGAHPGGGQPHGGGQSNGGQPNGGRPGGGHPGGGGFGGPAASGAELWSFEVVQSAPPATG
jgi:heme oxygenase (mycobilin-producing)